MNLALRSSSNLNLSRFFPFVGFVVLTLLSFAAFRMPVAAGVGAGALIILALGLRFPLITLYVYAATTFLSYVPLGGAVGVPTATGGIFLLAAGLEASLGNAPPRASLFGQKSQISRWLMLFWIACCVSVLANPREFLSNPRGLITYGGLAITVPAVAFLVRTDHSIVRLSQILTWGAISAAALTCYQSLTGSYNTFGFFHSGPPAERAYGFADPIYTSATLDTIFPLLFALLITAKRTRVKAALTIALLVTLIAVGMTASRGGFLGLVLSGILCLFMISPTTASWTRTSIVKRLGVTVLLVGVFGVALYVSPENLWERVSTLSDEEKVGNESRLRVWEDYIKDIKERPWFGYGPGYITPDTEDERTIIQHSTPLEFLTEIGGFGFSAFVGLSLCILYELGRARSQFQLNGDAQMAAIASAMIAGFIAFHFTALFLNRGNDKQLWVLFGMAAAIISLAKRQRTMSSSAMETRVVEFAEVVA
jgi:O-antigen ligase